MFWLNKKRKKQETEKTRNGKNMKRNKKYSFVQGSRVGVIIDCSQKYLFHDLMNIILTSRIAVSEMVDNNNNNDWLLAVPLVKI